MMWYVCKNLDQMSTKKVYFVRYFKSLHLMFPYLLQIGLEVVEKGSSICSKIYWLYFSQLGLLGLKFWKNNALLVQISCYKSKFLILVGVLAVLSFHQTWIQWQIFVCRDFLMQKMPQKYHSTVKMYLDVICTIQSCTV